MTRRVERPLLANACATALLGCLLAPLSTGADAFPSAHVDDSGTIQFPEDFRASMVHLGSWFVPEGDASGFHDVYTEAGSVAAYRRTGRFPDGATIVKELRASASGSYTTGSNVRFATEEIKQWFVMVKDDAGRFEGNPNWGDGWGWALFKTDAPETNVSTDYRADCLGCHVPAQQTDWIYAEAYPTLTRTED